MVNSSQLLFVVGSCLLVFFPIVSATCYSTGIVVRCVGDGPVDTGRQLCVIETDRSQGPWMSADHCRTQKDLPVSSGIWILLFLMLTASVHVGTEFLMMRQYMKCDDSSYDVLPPSRPPSIAAFWRY
jgi:hypothetical protein